MEPCRNRPVRRSGTVIVALAASAGVIATTFGSAPVALAAATPSPVPAVIGLPKLPAVSLADTDGIPEATLYRRAIALTEAGKQDAPVEAAIAATQKRLDADAVAADRADRIAAVATGKEQRAAAAAAASSRHYGSLAGALRQSALDLYMSGPEGDVGPLDLTSASDLAWAEGFLATTVSPDGVLAERRAALRSAAGQAAVAKAQQRIAVVAAIGAGAAVSAERAAGARLEADLAAVDSASASTVAADHAVLASEAGRELTGPDALEFTPAKALPASLSTTSVALTWAFAELGVPYLWGGTGVGGFDCSGLTQYVWNKAGVTIPRVAADQDAWTDPVPLSQLLPGDLVFYGTSYIHHVGIYIGDGLMINAPHTGTVVQVSSIWWSDLAGFGRVHADGTPIASHQIPSPADPAPTVVVGAKPVPSQTKPPAGWKPTPGGSAPDPGYYQGSSGLGSTAKKGKGSGTTTTTTTTLPPATSTSTSSTSTSTTVVPVPTSSTTSLLGL